MKPPAGVTSSHPRALSSAAIELSVIVPTHNPDRERLRRTLEGLAVQSLDKTRWEVVVVDNASTAALTAELLISAPLPNARLVREPQLGLTFARRRGFLEAEGGLLVLVDDDNVIAPDYLNQVISLFAQYPQIGAMGGRSRPMFEQQPSAWHHEFLSLLAIRDLGDQPLIEGGSTAENAGRPYPAAAPIGAGMALRRAAIQPWLAESADRPTSDRRGADLASGGDNDIVLTLLRHGWSVGYFPSLVLTHLIPARRLEAEYLARLNRGIQKSWMQVLSRHGANPWPAIPAWSAPLRKLKACFVHRPWAGPAARVRWAGACGHFEGRVPSHGLRVPVRPGRLSAPRPAQSPAR